MTKERKQGWLAALTLVVWAPAAAELLTSSAPPFVFFVPWVFVLFALLYGLGALLIRETAVRLRLGWPAVLLLGAAYGVLEEGLGAKSFFDAHWRAIGPLGEHGRAFGVNWVWSIGLTGFHAFYSVGLSLLAMDTLWPAARGRAWLGKPGLSLAALLFGLDALLFYQKGNERFANSPAQSAGCLLVILALIGAALSMPRRREEPRETAILSWKRSFAVGFAAALLFTALLYFFPRTGASAWWTGALLIGLFVSIASLLRRWTSGARMSLPRAAGFGLLAGTYAFYAAQAPLQEFNPARPDSAAGMSLVGAAAAAGLWVWGRSVLRAESAGGASAVSHPDPLTGRRKEAHGC